MIRISGSKLQEGMYMKYIKDLKEGDTVNDIYLVKKKLSLTAKNGRAYDSLTLQDKTGSVDAKIWEPGSVGIEDFSEMDYVDIMEGDVPGADQPRQHGEGAASASAHHKVFY